MLALGARIGRVQALKIWSTPFGLWSTGQAFCALFLFFFFGFQAERVESTPEMASFKSSFEQVFFRCTRIAFKWLVWNQPAEFSATRWRLEASFWANLLLPNQVR